MFARTLTQRAARQREAAAQLSVSVADLARREALDAHLERLHFEVLADLSAIRCRLCGVRLGLACHPVVAVTHLRLAHGLVSR